MAISRHSAHLRGTAARSLLGLFYPGAPVGDYVDPIVIDEDTGQAFPDVDAVSFLDSSFIFTDSAAPENNKSSKAGFNIEDIYLSEPPDLSYPSLGGWPYQPDGTPGGMRHNALNFSRDFSNAAWTKSGVTPSYLTGETDRWGDEKVQRVTFNSGAGSGEYLKQSGSVNAGIRQQQRAVFAWRCPVGETVTFVFNNAFDSEHVVKQVTGTGDWVYDWMDYSFTSTSGSPKFIIQSKAGDTASYVDIKDLQLGTAHTIGQVATNYNDISKTSGRYYLPIEFDENGNQLGLLFPGTFNRDCLWNYSYVGLGSGAISGSNTNITFQQLANDALPYYNRPEGAPASYNADWEAWTKHTETTTANDAHHSTARATSPNQFQNLGDYSANIVFKKGTRRYVYMGIWLSNSDAVRIMVDLDTATVTDTSTTGTKLAYNDTIVRAYPNGGVWVSISIELLTQTTGEYFWLIGGHSDRATFTGSLSAGGWPAYTGTTNDYFYSSSPAMFEGAGHMPGPSNFGGAIDIDSCIGVYRPLSELPWDATDGTVVLTFTPLRAVSADSTFFYVGYDAQVAQTTYNIRVGYGADGKAYFRVSVASTNSECNITSVGTINVGQVNKLAITWGVNIFRMSLNGETAVEDTSGQISAINSNFKQLWLGYHGGAASSNAFGVCRLSDFIYVPQTKNANWLKNRSSVA
jgi:hypothetical protein